VEHIKPQLSAPRNANLPFGQIKKSCWYFIGTKQVCASFSLSVLSELLVLKRKSGTTGGELSLYLWALMTNKFQPNVKRGWSLAIQLLCWLINITFRVQFTNQNIKT
jgi:hypothetical protein